MPIKQVETYNKLILTQLFTNIWYGDWKIYENTLSSLPKERTNNLPFHPFYDPKAVKLAYEKHFVRPGEYFISPYVSSYYEKNEEKQLKARQDLLYLIGAYEKIDYYYPIEKDELPDHFGSVTGFITALLQQEIKAHEQNDRKLIAEIKQLQRDTYDDYLKAAIIKMEQYFNQMVDNQFFEHFLPYYIEILEVIVHS